MNGGFDHLCGRLVYYDGASLHPQHPPQPCPTPICLLRAEITSDFASQDSERIE